MLTFSCPSCGANVEFKSKASVFAVCSYCKSSLVRQDMNLQTYGKISDLQDDLSPLQIGTIGSDEERRFEVIGRLRIAYDDGFWNEWYVTFNDGKDGWLAEAQGFYAVCQEWTKTEIPDRGVLAVGKELNIPHAGLFEIDDMRNVVCVFSQGELPMKAAQGRESFSVDLRGEDLSMGTMEYAQQEKRLYLGYYKDFDTFKFKNLRKIDGW